MNISDRCIEVYGTQLIVNCPSHATALEWGELIARQGRSRTPAPVYDNTHDDDKDTSPQPRAFPPSAMRRPSWSLLFWCAAGVFTFVRLLV